MNWSSASKEDLDAASVTRAPSRHYRYRKTLGLIVFIGNLVRGERSRRPEHLGRSDERKTGVGAKKGKPIKTVLKCIPRGPIETS